ncbi:hypothetical protein GIB67_015718 [Kingdonia uniflora]|uniref:AAA+ ATPase domain-containing protein n=1 Tax=Kingdonia uniflora TaxID=39325 RepID=A0A7J7NUA0_9MAGN|nr:hypothetical protein GIB67_015718 [Kingdonia uniflora]
MSQRWQDRLSKNNPCLIGEPGVGKSAIAKGLAQCIVEKEVLSTLQDTKVNKCSLLYLIDMARLIAGTHYRGDFEERLVKVIDKAKQSNGSVILVINKVHTLVEAGKPSGKQDAASILKPALARGELKCMAATTHKEYKMHIEKDPALERHFQPLKVPKPTVEESIQILQGLRAKYETHHKVHYEHEAFVSFANLSYRYISNRFLPDKAIDLIDEAGLWVRFNHKNDFWGEPIVRESDRERIITLSIGIPVEKVSSKNVERLLKMEETLRKRVVGTYPSIALIIELTQFDLPQSQAHTILALNTPVKHSNQLHELLKNVGRAKPEKGSENSARNFCGSRATHRVTGESLSRGKETRRTQTSIDKGSRAPRERARSRITNSFDNAQTARKSDDDDTDCIRGSGKYSAGFSSQGP